MDKGKCYYGKIPRSEAPTNLLAAHIYRVKAFSEIGVGTLFCLVKQTDPAALWRSCGVFLFRVPLFCIKVAATAVAV